MQLVSRPRPGLRTRTRLVRGSPTAKRKMQPPRSSNLQPGGFEDAGVAGRWAPWQGIPPAAQADRRSGKGGAKDPLPVPSLWYFHLLLAIDGRRGDKWKKRRCRRGGKPRLA